MFNKYEYNKQWKKNNPEKVKAQKKRYTKKHPDIIVKHFEKVVSCDNHACRWSQEDAITVLNYSLSSRDLHVVLKRTVSSIENMRQRLKHRLTPLAGISSELLK